MEAVGHQADRFFGTVHTAANNGMIGTQKGSSISKSKDEWYTFEINWEEDRIQFAVDKQIYFEYLRGDSVDVWPFDQNFHLIMNIAVGGSWGGQQGINEASFEGAGQIMEIDWVRVYADTNLTQPTRNSQLDLPQTRLHTVAVIHAISKFGIELLLAVLAATVVVPVLHTYRVPKDIVRVKPVGK